jgi:hypothetical protein
VSGNSGGRPKGSKTFVIKALIAEALSDPGGLERGDRPGPRALKARKTVISGLEFATRVNCEIGLGGAGETPAGVTIIFESNIRRCTSSRCSRPSRAHVVSAAGARVVSKPWVTRIPTRMYSLALKGGKINHAPFIGMLQEHNVRTGFFEDNQFEAVRAHLLACAQPVVTFAYIKASGRHGSKRASRRAAPDASCMTSGARP